MSPVRLPKIRTLNSQIDAIEKRSEEAAARLASIEKLLQRIAERLER